MRYLIVFLLIAGKLFSQHATQDCIIKIKSGFGPVKSCLGEDSYHVVLKSNCTSAIDIVCGIQERSGEWKVFRKNGFAPGDTMLAYGCDGSGKYQYWVRYVGDTSHLPTYEELNPGASKGNSIDIFARLLYGDLKKKPLMNQKVELLNSKGESVQSAITDQKGDFAFHRISNSERYEVYVGDVNISDDEKLFLARQNGSILTELQIVKGKNYKYSFLPSDIITLSEMEVTNPSLALDLFKKNAGEKFVFSQRITYNSGSVSPSDLKELDPVVKFLLEEKGYNVEIVSHTDVRGDAAANLKLSVMRSDFVKDYFLKRGVQSSRIISTGKGENEIINHCKEGVVCSEEEHKLNRRTEFLFKRTVQSEKH